MLDSIKLEVSVPTGNGSWPHLRSLIRKFEHAGSAFDRVKDLLEELLQLTAVYERFESTWDESESMKQQLETSFRKLGENCAELSQMRMTECIACLCRDIRIELAHIRQDSLQHNAEADASRKLLARYRRIHTLLQALLLNTGPSTWCAPDQDAGVGIPYVPSFVDHSTRVSRRDLHSSVGVRRLGSWIHDSPPGAVCWVPGARQTGISRALCAELDATHKLGASLFLSPENHDFNSTFTSISRQLATYSSPFRHALINSSLQTSSEPLTVQFEELIAKPLTRVREALPTDLAVVIDAMDASESVRPILDAILPNSNGLPIKFIIFSRPEAYHGTAGPLFVHEIGRECVVEGVEGELRTSLVQLGLSELQLAEFVQRTGILFAYAAAAAHSICDETVGLKSSALSES